MRSIYATKIVEIVMLEKLDCTIYMGHKAIYIWHTSSVSNGSGLPGFGPGWNRTRGPGPGQEPPRNPNLVTSAGLLPGPDINPRFFGRVGTGPRFHFTVPTTLAELGLQLSFWALIVSRHDQYVDCAVLVALSPHTFRIAIRPIFVEWL